MDDSDNGNNNLDKIRNLKAEIFDLQIVYMKAKTDIETKMLKLKKLQKDEPIPKAILL